MAPKRALDPLIYIGKSSKGNMIIKLERSFSLALPAATPIRTVGNIERRVRPAACLGSTSEADSAQKPDADL
jgi:hypothetical protein